MVDLTVSIVNYNTTDLTVQCVQSILDSKPKSAIEIIVVDNGSEDADRLGELLPGVVTYIPAGANVGYAAGNNLAYRRSTGRHFLILNSDTLIPDGTIDRLVAYLDENPEVGIVGPKLLNADGTLQVSAANEMRLWTLFLQQSYLDKLLPNNHLLGNYFLADFTSTKPVEVMQISGAAYCVQRTVFETIGLMDEEYFMYCEDSDFSRRTRDAGWRIHYVPDVTITHLLGASSEKNREKMVIAYNRSIVRFFAMFDGVAAAKQARRLTIAGAFLRLLAWSLLAILPPWPKRARRQVGMFGRILAATVHIRVAAP